AAFPELTDGRESGAPDQPSYCPGRQSHRERLPRVEPPLLSAESAGALSCRLRSAATLASVRRSNASVWRTWAQPARHAAALPAPFATADSRTRIPTENYVFRRAR